MLLSSLSSLALYKLINLKIDDSIVESDQLSEFIKYCNGNIPEKRIFKDFSFIDELRTLQIGNGKEQIYNFLNSRYNDKEQFGLFGLRLGGWDYFSG